MLQLVLEGGSLVRPLHILSPVHWVGVEPTTLRDETSGRTTTPVEGLQLIIIIIIIIINTLIL